MPDATTITRDAQNAFYNLWTRKPAHSDHEWINALYDLAKSYQCSGAFGGSLFGCNWTRSMAAKKDQMVANLTRTGGQDAADAAAIAAYFKLNRNIVRGKSEYTLAPPATKPSHVHTGEVTPGEVVQAAMSNTVLGPLFQAHIWIRVGEVLLGVVLIAVGVARLTNVVPIATKIAKAVK